MKTTPARQRRSRRGEFADGSLRKVTAIVRTIVLEKVERRLQDLCVPGISVTRVKGYGEYANFFRTDWIVEHARIEIFLRCERADEVARAIIDAARTGGPGDGLVAVSPVDSVYRIRSGELATSDELGGCECISRSEATHQRVEENHGSVPR
jgi:nitrogen regulatory protein P-II 1